MAARTKGDLFSAAFGIKGEVVFQEKVVIFKVEEQQMASERFVSLVFVLIISSISSAAIATFDDLSLGPESYWNGSDSSGGFVSGSATFNNNYNPTYISWDGFAYSNITDTSSSDWTAQYNAITGGGESSSANYGIGYDPLASGFGTELPTMTLNTPGIIDGLYVTNNNFAYYSMLNGDLYSKKFGGDTGDEPDWFLLTITGKDTSGATIDSISFYLADYRFTDNSNDYIINTWEYVDLTELGIVKSLEFSLSSSDVGSYGINTPAYFALDTVVPEPGTLALLTAGFVLLIRKSFNKFVG